MTCSIWFIIQDIIQNTTCSVWFRIPGIIKKWPGYYSAFDSVLRVLFKILPAASGSGFRYYSKYDLQHLVHYSGYYSKYDLQHLVQHSGYYSIYDLHRLVHYSWYYSKVARYYSAYGSVFRILFKIRPAASGSGFSILLKNIQGIIQHLLYYSGYYSKYDLHRLVHVYSKYDLQRLFQDSGYY